VARKLDPVHGVIAHSLGGTATALAISAGLRVERAVVIAPPTEPTHFARAFAHTLGIPEARLTGYLAEVRALVGRDLESLDLVRLAPGQHTPLLVIHDPGDREVPYQMSQKLAAAWPHATLRSFEGLGHRRILADTRVQHTAVDFLHPRLEVLERKSA
jgi:pimeloyl-ACP methyl ester carboxylesterase